MKLYPLCAELHKAEEQQQYKNPLNLCYWIAQIASGVDIS
jgi:hypothetical protein